MKNDNHNLKYSKEDILWFYNSMQKRLPKILLKSKEDPAYYCSGTFWNEFFKTISYSSFASVSNNDIYQYLFYTLQFGINHFRLASNPGKELKLIIGESQIKVMGKETKDYIDSGSWEILSYMALILRDIKSFEILKSIPNSFLENPGISSDKLDFAVVDVMKSFDDRAKLKQTIENYYLIKEKDINDRKIFNKHLTDPFIKVLESIIENDQQSFDKRLEEALIFHKEFYREERKQYGSPGDPFGWLSYKLITACCYAYDNGLKIPVESDYLPKWMIEGDFTGCELKLK